LNQTGIGMNFSLTWARYNLNLDQRTHIMGVLNVTPDSFSDGGRYLDPDRAIDHGLEMASKGADIVDEIDRIIPVIEALHRELTIPISIDTYKGEVARAALKAGASIINDISALRFDPGMPSIAARAGVPVVLMHMKGMPENMQDEPTYGDLITDIMDFLRDAIKRAVEAGIREELIIVDPGIGFGKTFDHNLEIIRDLSRFAALNRPILLGTSNKGFIGHILEKAAHERETGSMATIAAGAMNGAHIVRTHNVSKTLETLKIIDAIKRGSATRPVSPKPRGS
jgi:dihydropteroate synthase